MSKNRRILTWDNVKSLRGLYLLFFFWQVLTGALWWEVAADSVWDYRAFDGGMMWFCLLKSALLLLFGGLSCLTAEKKPGKAAVLLILGLYLAYWSARALRQLPGSYFRELIAEGFIEPANAIRIRTVLLVNLFVGLCLCAILVIRVIRKHRRPTPEKPSP